MHTPNVLSLGIDKKGNNKSQHILSVYFVPGTVLGTSQILRNLFFSTQLWEQVLFLFPMGKLIEV